MLNPKLLRNLAVYGASLPTLAAPAAAKATVYIPSHIATKMLGGRAEKRVVNEALDRGIEADPSAHDDRAGTGHAA